MIEQTPFQRFVALVVFDQHIFSLRISLQAVEKEIAVCDAQQKIIEAVLHKAKQTVFLSKQQVHEKELVVRELDVQESKIKQTLDTVSSPREYASFKKELEAVQQKRFDLESDLIAVWQVLEHAENALSREQLLFDEKFAQVQMIRAEKETQKKQVIVQIDELLARREVHAQGIPDEWLEKYAVMRERVTNPVVPVQQNCCTACFFTVSVQDLTLLRQKRLLQCKQCFRFLYIQDLQ